MTHGPDAHATASLADGGAPVGYVRTTVLSVVSTEDGGNAVLLSDDHQSVLPIWIGGSEALTISYRLRGEQPDRPLTHDLLTTLVSELGGRAVEAHVDELRGDAFVGSMFVEQNGRVLRVDARPSDAIAMALGSGVPIYVSREVLAIAGVSRKDLERSRDETLNTKKRHGEPISL
jgi:bifunctional DNase/RNase